MVPGLRCQPLGGAGIANWVRAADLKKTDFAQLPSVLNSQNFRNLLLLVRKIMQTLCFSGRTMLHGVNYVFINTPVCAKFQPSALSISSHQPVPVCAKCVDFQPPACTCLCEIPGFCLVDIQPPVCICLCEMCRYPAINLYLFVRNSMLPSPRHPATNLCLFV